MPVGTIAEICLYPVKSMRGQRVQTAEVHSRGFGGDREFALIDSETGNVASAKRPDRWGRLLLNGAAVIAAPEPDGTQAVCIGVPGTTLRSDDPDVHKRLSDFAGRAVRLCAQAPENPEIERYNPDVPGFSSPGSMTRGELGGGAPGRTFFDYAPVHIVTTASLRRLQSPHRDASTLAKRFRPNLVIDSLDGEEEFAENAWVGREVRIGRTATLFVITPTPRCIVPTLPQPGIPRDVGLLRAIAKTNCPAIPIHNERPLPSFGMYAAVTTPGVIAIGDEVTVARRPQVS